MFVAIVILLVSGATSDWLLTQKQNPALEAVSFPFTGEHYPPLLDQGLRYCGLKKGSTLTNTPKPTMMR
jgi:hypothetical protein